MLGPARAAALCKLVARARRWFTPDAVFDLWAALAAPISSTINKWVVQPHGSRDQLGAVLCCGRWRLGDVLGEVGVNGALAGGRTH